MAEVDLTAAFSTVPAAEAEEIKRVKARVLEYIQARNAREASSSLRSPSVQPPPAPASTPEEADPPRPEGQNAGQNPSADAPDTQVV